MLLLLTLTAKPLLFFCRRFHFKWPTFYVGGSTSELAWQQLSNHSARLCRYGEYGCAHENKCGNQRWPGCCWCCSNRPAQLERCSPRTPAPSSRWILRRSFLLFWKCFCAFEHIFPHFFGTNSPPHPMHSMTDPSACMHPSHKNCIDAFLQGDSGSPRFLCRIIFKPCSFSLF